MRVVVAGFRGIERADLRLAPIALVGGPNEGGKTSLCQAVAAAVTGQPIPRLDGEALATKAHAEVLVRDGAERGVVTVTSHDEESGDLVSVVWPSCERISAGARPPQASPIAAGMVRLAALSPAERAAALVALTGALPDRADLDAALHEVGIDPNAEGTAAAIEALWQSIETDGWDLAHGKWKERGARVKGQWQEVTGVGWGARKAAAWMPADWTADLDVATADSLAAAVAAARSEVDARIADGAASEAELALLRTQAARGDQAEAQRTQLHARLAAAEQRLSDADAARKALPEVAGDSGLPCPWCSHHVRVGRGDFGEMVLERFESVETPEEHDARHRAIVAAEKEAKAAAVALPPIRSDLALAEATARGAAAAVVRLAEIGDDAAALQVEIGEARKALATAESRLAVFERRRRATVLRNAVEANAKVIAILAADGLRQTRLLSSLKAFNAVLARICDGAGWQTVIVDTDMHVARMRRAGGGTRSYEQVSASARWRVDLVLQLAAAEYEAADLLVVDAMDICDSRHRNAALGAIIDAGRPALVTMTCSAWRLLPDLGRAEMGHSYWLENGVLSALAQVAEVAAA